MICESLVSEATTLPIVPHKIDKAFLITTALANQCQSKMVLAAFVLVLRELGHV